MRAWLLLSAVLCYLAGIAWSRSSLLSEKGLVYGKIGHPVKIYVKLHQNSPVLVCMDSQRASKETVDPTYLWIGPNEKTLTGNNRISITKTGRLILKDFLELLSGLYTCTFSYKTVKAETQEETIVKKRYDFMVFAYQEPDYSYQMAVRFTTKSCVGRYNEQLFRLLKKILNNLISDLSCHIIEPSYKCHVVKIPEHDLTHELFIAFQVNLFTPGWRGACNESDDCEDATNHNILKARDRIEEFFHSQADILYHRFNKTLPAMHFVNHSFHVVRVDSCRPGFGKNEGLHSNCASCCVVCSPGTFSPDIDVTCQICISVRVYGAKSCP
ncbi:zona pellucida-binding protein 2 isoform X1 [Fukomys damarensis]|uniref:Zona pellucida-binding protein 2 n=1 Tax=Fukomys damarensis TaxID=885580 RepID=A0A091EHF3_FUKDA|nr:zona pellucida-binding protein 2 isoform X1 [Fukomys damarensis]KFO34886.1 Zona pellucida-binding protein 2 [Fukomys damarensis]